MARKHKQSSKRKIPFYKNINNWILMIASTAMLVFFFTYRWQSDGRTGAERFSRRFSRTVTDITQGCDKPPKEEIEAFYNDNSGSIPVPREFDAADGEICGNGRTWYCTSKPPKKPIPAGWKKPPRIGADPDYDGPSPFDPFKESPYAMPSSKAVRARAPIVDRNEPRLIDYVDTVLANSTSKVGIVEPGELNSAMTKYRDRVVPLPRRIFEVDDDAVVAQRLSAMNIDYVIYDRLYPPVAPWMENKMDQVGVRMRDGVSLHHLFPTVLGSRYVLYRRVSPFHISKAAKRRITRYVRRLIEGDDPETLDVSVPLDATGDRQHHVILSLRKRNDPRVKGRKLIKRMGRDPNFEQALRNATQTVQSDWARVSDDVHRVYGARIDADLSQAIDQMEIEIDVLYHQCYLSDRYQPNLVWYLELGLEGVLLSPRDGGDAPHYLEPSYAIQRETNSETIFLEQMLQKNGLDQFLRDPKKKSTKRPKVLWQHAFMSDKEFDFKRFRVHNWIERPKELNRDIVDIYRGVPLKTIWDVSYNALIHSLELGASWLINNQTPDGQFRYRYEPLNREGRRWFPGGNIVRHALNPYTLLMVNKLSQKNEYVDSAAAGIDFTLKFLRKDGNRCVICHRDPPALYYNAKLNAVAVTILSILKLGDVADISRYDDVLRCMAEQMLYMQNKNGHFWQYDVPEDHPYYGAESTIHAGEFIFVLARLYSHYKEERFKDACDRAIAFYMQQWDRMVEDRTPNGIYNEENRVNLIGIVPWLVTAMEDLHKETGDEKYAELGLRCQDWIDNEFFWWQHRAQYPDYVGASFKTHWELPAVNSCQYAEGAGAAYAIAKRLNRDVETRRQVVVYSMRYCLQVQHDGYDSTFFVPVPEDAMGGYKYTMGHLRVRNDYNYHAMAAIAMAAEYLEPYDYPQERPLRIAPVLRELLEGRPNPAADVTVTQWRQQQEQEDATASTTLQDGQASPSTPAADTIQARSQEGD